MDSVGSGKRVGFQQTVSKQRLTEPVMLLAGRQWRLSVAACIWAWEAAQAWRSDPSAARRRPTCEQVPQALPPSATPTPAPEASTQASNKHIACDASMQSR